ncbi:MAG TPA: hypothetical protein VGI95_05000 [Caulobacteraceae bacterium]
MRRALAGLMLAGLPAVAGAADDRPSLCAKHEIAVFSCAVGHKVASLCASPDLGPTSGYLYYAYGKSGRADISVPEKNLAGRSAISRGVLGFSGGGADYVRVRHGAYAYVVYTGMAPGWERDGVVVERGGVRQSSLRCRGFALGRDAWKVVYGAKLLDDTVGFDLP